MKNKSALRLKACASILIILALFNVYRLPAAGAAGVATEVIPVQTKQTQYCSAFAPADWSFWTDSTASTAEALSADRTMYAGWAVLTVNQELRPVYGDLYGPPEVSIRFMTNRILRSLLGESRTMRYTSLLRPFLNAYTLINFESDQSAGIVFYRVYPGSIPERYTEAVYWAIAKKFRRQEGLKIAAGAAVSIRCSSPFRYPSQEQAWTTGMMPARPGCGASEALAGYQKELGIQYVHSPRTGQNYLVDPSTQWNAVGPYGPGYYRRIGDSYERLMPGWHDGC